MLWTGSSSRSQKTHRPPSSERKWTLEPVTHVQPAHEKAVHGADDVAQPAHHQSPGAQLGEPAERLRLLVGTLPGEDRLHLLLELVARAVGGVEASGDPLTEAVGEQFLELAEDGPLARQHDGVAVLLVQEPRGRLHHRAQVPVQVGQAVPLHLRRPRLVHGHVGDEAPKVPDLLLAAQAVGPEASVLPGHVHDEHPALLLEDDLQGLDEGIEVDGQPVAHPHRKGDHAVQLFTRREDHQRRVVLGKELAEEVLDLREVVPQGDLRVVVEALHEVAPLVEHLAPHGVEDSEVDPRRLRVLGRDLQVEAHHWRVVDADQLPKLVARDQARARGGLVQRARLGLLAPTLPHAGGPHLLHPALALVERLPEHLRGPVDELPRHLLGLPGSLGTRPAASCLPLRPRR
jgi:hypothetical protein